MSTFLGLLPFVFGAVAIVVYARAKRPVVRSLGLTVSRWSPLEVVIGLAITFVAIGLTFGAELTLGAIRLKPGTAEDVLVLTGGTYGPEAGIPGMLARFVVIGLVVLYLSRRWPDGRFATLTYAPEPEPRRRA